MKIKFLKALNGDSIILSFTDPSGEKRNILIDGGVSETYKVEKNSKGKPEDGELKKAINKIRTSNEFIDLLIITHIDEDHISGILKWFEEDEKAYEIIKEVWFNSGENSAQYLNIKDNEDLKQTLKAFKSEKTSVKEGIEFANYIAEKGIWKKEVILQGKVEQKFGVTIKILSPNKKKLIKLIKDWRKKEPDLRTASKGNDYGKSLKEHIKNDVFNEDAALPNGSSIAFILCYNDKNILFLGDSYPSTIIEGLRIFGYSEENPIKLELLKISHHGSKENTNVELLKMIDCHNYVVSTNGRIHEHPHKQFLARLINEKKECNIYFNYEERMKEIFYQQDKIDYPSFKTIPLTNDFEV